jgi:hypothetical protein
MQRIGATILTRLAIVDWVLPQAAVATAAARYASSSPSDPAPGQGATAFRQSRASESGKGKGDKKDGKDSVITDSNSKTLGIKEDTERDLKDKLPHGSQ